MDEYSKTTGKDYDGSAYICKACGKKYLDDGSGECPHCNSQDKEQVQQTTAELHIDKKPE